MLIAHDLVVLLTVYFPTQQADFSNTFWVLQPVHPRYEFSPIYILLINCMTMDYCLDVIYVHALSFLPISRMIKLPLFHQRSAPHISVFTTTLRMVSASLLPRMRVPEGNIQEFRY
jgi:hypothetical protein